MPESTIDITPAAQDRILAHHAYLTIGILLGGMAVALWTAQLATKPDPVLDGLFELFRVAAVAAACGYFVKRSERAQARRLARIEARLDQVAKCAYAEGYVDSIQNRSNGLRPVR